MYMSTRDRYTIAIRSEASQVARKVTKIIGLQGNGSSVLAPYHKARSGYLFKMPVDPQAKGVWSIPWDETIGFTAESHVKLTYYTDGFVQFSSEKPGEIISGRDPMTGEPKGLGLFTCPLESPIWSGSSVGVTLWGLDDFEPLDASDNEALVFEPRHYHYRACTPTDANAWKLEFHTFPSEVIPPIRWEEGHFLLDVAIEPLNGPLISVKRLSILHLPKEKVFLGVAINRFIHGFPSISGWVFSGPGDWTSERKGYVLMGVYPREQIDVEGRPTLDRKSL